MMLALVMAATLSAAAGGTDFILAERGRSASATIVVPANPEPAVLFAAEQLRDYVAKATDVVLPIATNATPPRAVHLGRRDATVGADGFAIAADADSLVVASANARGTLYGVCELLERFGGIGWYASWHEVVPKADRFAVPVGTRLREAPAFPIRDPFWFDVNYHPVFAAHLRKNNSWLREIPKEYGGEAAPFSRVLPGHTFNRMIPPEVYFKDHPDWFSEINGKRVGHHSQLCCSNPEVIAFVTDFMRRQMRKEPEARLFALAQNDWNDDCTCAKCRAINAEEGARSGAYWRMVKTVAEGLRDEFPDKIVCAEAYMWTREPPRKMAPLPPNVWVCLSPIELDFSQPIDGGTSPENVRFARMFRDWSRLSPGGLKVFDYNAAFIDYFVPFPTLKAFRANLRLYRKLGAKYVLNEGDHCGRGAPFAELKAWVGAKLMWNPEADERELVRRFMTGFYGKAADAVGTCFWELESYPQGARPLDCIHETFATAVYSDEFLDRALALWDAAEKAVRDDPAYLYNVRLGKLSVVYQILRRRLPAAVTGPRPDADARLAELARWFVAFTEANGDLRWAEDHGSPQEIGAYQTWKKVAAAADPAKVFDGSAEETAFWLIGRGRWVSLVDDPAARDGRAARIAPNSWEWCMQMNARDVRADEGARYRVRLRLRVEFNDGVPRAGEAFSAGYSVSDGKGDPAHSFGKSVSCADVSSGYVWQDVGEWTPRKGEEGIFWVASGKFDRDASACHPCVKAVFVDAIAFEPVAVPRRPPAVPRMQERLIAHRGESADAPENTLPAYRTAVERGFGFECDIYLSQDKRLFTFHDTNLKRTTGGANTNRCTDVDWAGTVSKVNVGGWGKWKGSKFDPTRPALFSEVLDLARDGRWIYVEVKGNDPGWVPYIKAEVAKSKKAHAGNILFISFSDRICAELKRQMPDFRVYFLTQRRKGEPADALIKKLRAIGADGVDIYFDPLLIDADYISAVKAAGFSFHVWTVDDPILARRAFACGADTLTTNRAKFILESPDMPARGLCAHRGDRATYPENSVASFRSAVAKGAAMVELDVDRCKTGELVIMHDPTVDRTSDGRGKVTELTFAEIRRLDIGIKKGKRFLGTRIPTFDEAIDSFPYDGVWINVHCKGSVTAEVARKLKAKGRLHQAFIAADTDAGIRAAREAVPEVMTCYMGGPWTEWTEKDAEKYFAKAIGGKYAFAQPPKGPFTRTWADRFHAAGGRLNFFWLTDPARLPGVFSMGVDFPLVDNLDLMLPLYRKWEAQGCPSAPYKPEPHYRGDQLTGNDRKGLVLPQLGRIDPPLAPDRPGAVRPTGWLLDRARAAKAGFTGHLGELDEHFRIAWTTNAIRRGALLQWFDRRKGSWSAEGGAYWLDGLVRLAWQLDDPDLKALARRRLEPVLENVGTNSVGLIWWLDRNNPKDLEEAQTYGSWHLNWVLGTAVRPIAAYYEATGDARAKRVLENAYSSLEIAKRFGGGYSCSFPSGALEAWRQTKSPAVSAALDASLRHQYASQFAKPPWELLADTLNLKREHVRYFGQQGRHGVASYERFLSLLALYERYGETRIRSALEIWCDFFDRHCEQPYGAPVSDEEWSWTGAHRGTETCVVAAKMAAYIRMEALFADGWRGDEVERTYFNAGAATVSRDFKRHVYMQLPNRTGIGNESVDFSSHNDAENTHYLKKHWPLCCSASLNRILPSYVQGLWMKTAEGGVAAALYGPCTYETSLASGAVALTERTDYPFSEEIAISVDRAPGKPFPLKLRIPRWCASPAVSVNGERISFEADRGFATVNRPWKAGDVVTLRFPMRPEIRRWRDKNDFGKERMSIVCGPLAFSLGLPGKDDNTLVGAPREPVLSTALDAASISVERRPMPKVWDWPFDAPVKLHLTDAEGAPLELIPYGCTKLRVTAFPVADPTSAKVKAPSGAPAGRVAIVTDAMRDFLARPHYERAGLLLDPSFRARAAKVGTKPNPHALAVPAEADRVEIAKTAGDGRRRTLNVRDGVAVADNLEVGAAYVWKAMKGNVAVAEGRFTTEDGVPRVCRIDGLDNVRDIGGGRTLDGRRIRQGLIYRSDKLTNEHTPKGRRAEWRVQPRLTDRAVREALDTFGFRTELDLRTDDEAFGIDRSPLGPTVRFVRHVSADYESMKDPKWAAAFAADFRELIRPGSLPLLFHCAGGADRTGTFAFLVEGILGLRTEDMWKDWEITAFWYDKPKFNHWNYMGGLTRFLDERFPNQTLQEQCVAYAKEIAGLTDGEIRRLRDLMLVP